MTELLLEFSSSAYLTDTPLSRLKWVPQKRPRMMLADASFLPHRIVGAAFVGMTAVAKQVQDAIGRRWQGRHELLRQPADEPDARSNRSL